MDRRVGAVLRAVRRRRRLRQSDVARTAGVAASTVSRLERGHLDACTFGTASRVAAALDVRLDVVPRWRGGELDRLLNAGHSAMHEQVARLFASMPAWRFVPEASFSVYGERGAIDVLAWHEARRMLLVVELKTEIVDVQALVGSVDRKRRLATTVGVQRGWAVRNARTSAWVVVADTRTNRARLAAHVALLRAVFPLDGRTIRRWLPDPLVPVGALSFLQIDRTGHAMSVANGSQRVRIESRGPATVSSSTGPRSGAEAEAARRAVTEPGQTYRAAGARLAGRPSSRRA
jgi:transcriptional regulator with XRE-family HTH domain